MLTYELSPVAGITRYSIATTDRRGRAIGSLAVVPDATGRTCTPPLRLAGSLDADTDTDRSADGYTIVQIRTTRHALDRKTWVHLARRDGATRVIGVWRQ